MPRTGTFLQELVLVQPDRTLESEFQRAAAEQELRREFEERLAECGALAFRVARAVLRNSADAEDVAQEAALRAFRKFAALRDRNRFRAWLVRIAFRLALDRRRSQTRRETRETEWALPERAAYAAGAEQRVAGQEFQARLEAALDQLPAKQRLVLLLSAIEGYSIEEVAALLRMPAGTVKSRLFFARKQLAEKLR